MKVYIVFTERGSIYSVRKNKLDAKKDKAKLAQLCENATIKEFTVQ